MKNNKFLSNTSWIIGGKIGQMAIGLLVGIFVVRYLGPSHYGTISYVASFIALFTPIAGLGLNTFSIKSILDYPEQEGTVIGTILTMKILASILSAICVCITVYFFNQDEPMLVFIAFLQSIGLVFQSFNIFDYWYQSKLQSKISSIIALFGYMIISLYKIILLVLGKDIYWFAFSSSLDYIIIAICLFISYQKNHGEKLSFSFHMAKNLLQLSYHFILSGLMVTIYGQMDKVMIGKMISTEEVGNYSVAVAICGMWTFILTAILDSSRPLILTYRAENLDLYRTRLCQLYSVIMFISFSVAIVISLFSEQIIYLLYGEGYINAIQPLRIVVWYTSFSFFGSINNGIYLTCEGKQRFIKVTAFIGAVTNLTLNFILIPNYGINGAAFATLATQITANFIAPMFIKEINEIPKNIITGFKMINVSNLKQVYLMIRHKS